MTDETCPHGCGTMVAPVGDVLEPAMPYCPDCGHIAGTDCGDACYFGPDFADTDPRWPEPGLPPDQSRSLFALAAVAMTFGFAAIVVVFTVSVVGGNLLAMAAWLIGLLVVAIRIGVFDS